MILMLICRKRCQRNVYNERCVTIMKREYKEYLESWYGTYADETVMESKEIAGDNIALYALARVCKNDKKKIARMAESMKNNYKFDVYAH